MSTLKITKKMYYYKKQKFYTILKKIMPKTFDNCRLTLYINRVFCRIQKSYPLLFTIVYVEKKRKMSRFSFTFS